MSMTSLVGRVPKVTSAMSPRVIYIGLALAVVGICFIIYGFKSAATDGRSRRQSR